jgi:hypothetical protein
LAGLVRESAKRAAGMWMLTVATRVLLALVVLMLSLGTAVAQFESASVLGYTKDASGAAVSSSTVTLTNTATGIVQTRTSDGEGRFEFPSVPIGTYVIATEANGFDTTQTQPFTVTTNARQRVDVTLKAGSVSETVTVSAAPTLLETETSSRGQVIGERQIENLPLNGRSYADLALLVPGVRKSVLENQTTSSREASFNVNGQRSAFNNFLLDGLDNNSYGTSNQGFANENIPPSPDAISEFRIETNNYSAEFGRASGAVINASFRRGTNQFHGRVWEYNRNTALNAIGPFLPSGGVKPTFIRNQFGGTLGGPIFKDKTFFFADYEGARQITKSYSTATLPTAEQRAGTFFLHTTSGTTLPIPVRNPVTGVVYANGVVPITAMTPFARAVLAALPANNVSANPSSSLSYANNYVNLPRGTIQDDKGDIRLDHTFNAKLSVFARYSRHDGTIADGPTIGGAAGGNSNNNVNIHNEQIAVGGTYTVTPTSLLDARIAVTWNEGGKTPYGLGQPSLLIANGITNGIPTDPKIARSLNGQTIGGGFSQFGAQTSNPQFQNPFVINPKLNYTFLHGRHSVKVGYEYQNIATDIDDFNPVYGQDNYSGAYATVTAPTCTAPVTVSPCTPADSGTGNSTTTQLTQARNVADFLFGNRNSYQLNNYVIVHLKQQMNFMYVQDDVKLSQNVTVNAGLRYELVTPQYEQDNHLANFDPTTNTLVQASGGSLYNRALVNMPLTNFAPRFGFAATVMPGTVVRGGYGISYTQFNRAGGENLLVYNGPYIVGATINNPTPTGSNQCTSDTQDQTLCFRTTQQGYSTTLVSPSAFSPLKAQSRYIPKNNKTGYVQSYHLSVQHQFGGSLVLDLAYVGNHGVHLQVLADQNQAGLQPNIGTATCNAVASPTGGTPTYTTTGCLSQQARRPIQTFAGIEVATGAGTSNYNALQAKIEKRYGNGLYLLNSFTFGRAFDVSSGHLETSSGDNSRVNIANIGGDYGASSYDQPLNNTTSIVWDLPYGKGRHWGSGANFFAQELLGGWQMTIINTTTSGLPTNLTYGANSAYNGISDLVTYRPNVSGNPVASASARVKTSTAVNGYLDPTKVSIPTGSNPYGNARRNPVRGYDFNQLDLGLHKAFALWREGSALDFRAESFNLLNHVNYQVPDGNRGNSTFGQVTGFFPARQLQLAAKLIF